MPSNTFTESIVEEAALAWLAELGYQVLHGPRHRLRCARRRAERSELSRCDPRRAAAPGTGAAESRPAVRGTGGRLPQADAARRALPHRAQPRRASHAGRRHHGRVPPRRTAPSPGHRPRSSTSTIRPTTTGWRSTSSPWPRASTRGGRTWCSSSTACRSPSSS